MCWEAGGLGHGPEERVWRRGRSEGLCGQRTELLDRRSRVAAARADLTRCRGPERWNGAERDGSVVAAGFAEFENGFENHCFLHYFKVC